MGRSIASKQGPLPKPSVVAKDKTLTQFSGLLPLIRFMAENLAVVAVLARVAGRDGKKRVYAVHLVHFAFLAGAFAGTPRLARLEWLRGDAVQLKYLWLPRWPVRRVFSSAPAGVVEHGAQRLRDLVALTGLSPLVGLEYAALDMDGSVVVTFGTQEGAAFGYSGKGPNRRRHHPLVASAGEHRVVVHAGYRDGSAVPAEEAIVFASQALTVLRSSLADLHRRPPAAGAETKGPQGPRQRPGPQPLRLLRA